jgi:hypothetical protein
MISCNYTLPTELCKIMGDLGSDKGNQFLSGRHTYTPVYSKILEKIRYNSINIFELGLGSLNSKIPCNMNGYSGENYTPGNSLIGWKQYCPNALIYGADFDKDTLFQTDRIKTFFCDQTQPSIIKDMWSKTDCAFDLIIDDGLHTYEANVCFFENSVHKLKNGGYFVIEDIHNAALPLFENKIKEWRLLYDDLTFQIFRMPHERNNGDNNLCIIQKRTKQLTPQPEVNPPQKKFVWNRR